MILYDSNVAPNPRRVRIFLAEKGIEVPIRQIDIGKAENREPPYLAKNPLGGLPILELDDGTCIAESVAICRYFEEHAARAAAPGHRREGPRVVEMWNRRMELEISPTIAGAFRNTHDFFKGRIEQVPEWGEVCREPRGEARVARPRAGGPPLRRRRRATRSPTSRCCARSTSGA